MATRTLRALIASPSRDPKLNQKTDRLIWPLGASVIVADEVIEEELDALGERDPTELCIPQPNAQGIHTAPLLLVCEWEGVPELDEDVPLADQINDFDRFEWENGKLRRLTSDELAAIEVGGGALLRVWKVMRAEERAGIATDD
jgi:hypothetical protein